MSQLRWIQERGRLARLRFPVLPEVRPAAFRQVAVGLELPAVAQQADPVRPEQVVPEQQVVALERPQPALRPVAVVAAVGQAFAVVAQMRSTR